MKNKHAQSLGKLGGLVKSEAKAKAVRENGKLGGRPKKKIEMQVLDPDKTPHRLCDCEIGGEWIGFEHKKTCPAFSTTPPFFVLTNGIVIERAE